MATTTHPWPPQPIHDHHTPPTSPMTSPPLPSRGKWLPALTCPLGSRLISFRLRVEEPRALWDDTAANNLDMACADGTVLEGNGGRAGTWGNWSEACGCSWGICGLKTRVETPQRLGDDTGLNSALFWCCPGAASCLGGGGE
uniref:Vitelline membrane outer layer protein 1 homolog n=1 Tax=Otus sunia TaxID=257818 RepID=A0A8C8AIW8_9STRI